MQEAEMILILNLHVNLDNVTNHIEICTIIVLHISHTNN